MKKILLFIVIFICHCNISCEPTIKKTMKNEWIDSLKIIDYKQIRQSPRILTFVTNGTKIDTNATLNALINLTIKAGNVYKTYGLEILALHDPQLFYDIIVKNAQIITNEDWEMFARSLRMGKFTERDTLVLEAITATIVRSKPEDVHYSIASFLSERGGFKIAKTFSKLLKKNFSNECKHNFIDCMVKFKDAEFDSIVKTFISPKGYNDTISPDIPYFMDAYERYDLLPELKAFRSNVKNGKIKTEDETLLSNIDEYITNLEQKKDISAPIGLPLDWPKSGPPCKWSGM